MYTWRFIWVATSRVISMGTRLPTLRTLQLPMNLQVGSLLMSLKMSFRNAFRFLGRAAQGSQSRPRLAEGGCAHPTPVFDPLCCGVEC